MGSIRILKKQSIKQMLHVQVERLKVGQEKQKIYTQWFTANCDVVIILFEMKIIIMVGIKKLFQMEAKANREKHKILYLIIIIISNFSSFKL